MGTVRNMPLATALRSRALAYSLSVIKDRAIPDINTGLKPVHRRIIYDMDLQGLNSKSKPKKSAKIVGDTLGRFQPHGDIACYGGLVGMSQTWVMRYPLVEMDCNNGSIDGDPAAAMRYTEARLSKYGDLLLEDIDKDTVEFVDNYDGTEKEPVTLPGAFPGFLANGSEGIAVGMSTYAPPHNLTEIYDACIFMVDRVLNEEDYDLKDIMGIIKAPDFPWGGVITSLSGLKQAYETGKGKIVVRCKYTINEETLNKKKYMCIRISEIPFKEKKVNIIEKIEKLSDEGIIDGIYNIIDETNKDNDKSVNIAIYLKKNANPELIMNQLFKMTTLQKNINFNWCALINGQPKQVGLIEILDNFVLNCLNNLIQKSRYEFNNLSKRLEILNAVLRVRENHERAVEIILNEESPKEILQEEFELTQRQAEYVYNMKVRELNNSNIEKLSIEKEKVSNEMNYLDSIISDEAFALSELKSKFEKLKEEYGDERRSDIHLDNLSISEEDLIPDEHLIITLSSANNIKAVSEKEYVSQKRGGKGTKGLIGREDETLTKIFSVNNKDTIIFCTNKGRGYFLKAYKINKSSRNSKGRNIANYITLEDDEKIIDTVAIRKDSTRNYLVFTTKHGLIKKLHKDDLPKRLSTSCKLITLVDDDELAGIDLAEDGDDIMMVSKNGLATRFDLDNLMNKKRPARGCKGMKLDEGDEVISALIVHDEGYIVTLTDTGLAKKTKADEFGCKGRNCRGVKAHKTNGANLVSAEYLTENDGIIVFTSKNNTIRIDFENISEFSRNAGGSKSISMELDEYLIGSTRVPNYEIEEND